MSTQQFQVCDKVSWMGVEGFVTNISSIDSLVTCGFEDKSHVFFSDGRQYLWHKESSLKLIERPKKKKTVLMSPCIHRCPDGIRVSSIIFKCAEVAVIEYPSTFISWPLLDAKGEPIFYSVEVEE